MKKQIRLFFKRLPVAWNILTRQRHVIAVCITKPQVYELIETNTINSDINIQYFGLMQHQAGQVLHVLADRIDPTDLICEKANFINMVDERLKQQQNEAAR